MPEPELNAEISLETLFRVAIFLKEMLSPVEAYRRKPCTSAKERSMFLHTLRPFRKADVLYIGGNRREG